MSVRKRITSYKRLEWIWLNEATNRESCLATSERQLSLFIDSIRWDSPIIEQGLGNLSQIGRKSSQILTKFRHFTDCCRLLADIPVNRDKLAGQRIDGALNVL